MRVTGSDRETLRRAITLATRAPSVHNTQPWRWVIGAESVHLFADWTRHVPVTDPDGRDLVISCGAALHHLRIALAGLGWTSVVHRIPNPADPAHLAAIEFRAHEPTAADTEQVVAIERRHTDRRRLSSWPVAPELLAAIAARAGREGAFAVPVTDPVARVQLTDAVARAAAVQQADPDYTLELALWSGRSRGARDGVQAASSPPSRQTGSGGAGLRAFPHGTLAQPVSRGGEEQAVLVVIATSGDDPLSRLRGGEATSAALLAATELGLATCPLSQPLEIGDTRRMIRDDVLDGAAIPQLLLRLGWAPTWAGPLPESPRRDPDEVISSARDWRES